MIATKVQQMAQWLTIVSWVAVILGLLTALAIAFDVAAHPQQMKIMNVVWPITGLYLPIVGWLLYADMARRKPTRDMHAAHDGRPFWKSVFVSTTHCAAGCVIGDIIGAPIVFWAGWTLFGSRLYADYIPEYDDIVVERLRAAGAIVDGAFMTALGEVRVERALSAFSTAALHERAGTAIRTGPTGHNLCDLHILARGR